MNAQEKRVIQGDSNLGISTTASKDVTRLHCTKTKGVKDYLDGLRCFGGRNRGTFCPHVVKSVNKGVYVELLAYLLLSVLKRVHDTLGDSIFQPGDAPVHKAAVVMDFFKKFNIQAEDCPPYSPDLKHIEHVWAELKRRLHRKYPDIGNITRGPD
jgi:transposase